MKKLIWTLVMGTTLNLAAEPLPTPSLQRIPPVIPGAVRALPAEPGQTNYPSSCLPVLLAQAQTDDPSQAMIVLSDFFLRLGNLRQNEQFFVAFQKVATSKAAEGKVAPKTLHLVDLLLAKTRLLGGQLLLARQGGEEMLAWAQEQGDPEEVLEVYACLLLTAQKGGLPEVTARYLPAFEAAVEKAPPEQAPTWQFLRNGFREFQALEKTPSLTVAEFCQRHDAAWKVLEGLKQSTSRPMTGRVLGEVARIWLSELCTCYREQKVKENTPEDTRFGESLTLEADQLVRLTSLVRPGEMHDFEALPWAFNLIAFLTDMHRQVVNLKINTGSEDVLKTINELEALLAPQEPGLIQAEQVFQKQLPAELMVHMPAGFQVSLTAGDWALTRMRIRQAQLLQLMGNQPGKMPPEILKKARKLAQEAVTINAKALQGVGYQGYEDPRWTALSLLLNQRPSGWENEADKLLGQLRETNSRLGNREGNVFALTTTAELQLARGQKGGALATLQSAVDTVEQYVVEVGASTTGAERIRTKYRRAYELLAELQINQGQVEKAWQTLSRQQELEAAQQNQASLRDKQQVQAVQKVRGEMAVLEQQLASDRSLGLDTQKTEQLLAQNKGDYQRVVADLRRTHPQYEAAMAVRPVEFLELKKSIPADTTAVLYFIADDGLYIFVASRSNELKIHKVSVGAKELEKSVMKVRQLITSYPTDPSFAGHPESFRWNDPASPGYARHTQPLKKELAQLHTWLVKPLLADLQDRPVVALVPTGILHFVPFPALCQVDAQGNPRFLAEKFQCVNLVKTSDLIPRGSEKGNALCALGNPDGSLPGAEREVKSIVKSFPKAKQYLGAEASAARLRKLDPGTGYVHLATHGELSGSDPKNSYLVMAGKGDEQRFRATDIYDLDWQGVRLVTLSACKTALQEGNPGAAITNLAEAFRVAGGQSVVASLWSVADEATEKLMVQFYQELAQGKSLAAALQQAEIQLSKQQGLGHPYYWAAFTLFGDWR